MVLWMMLACGGTPAAVEAAPFPVSEAYDVPPPPGQRTLDLGPVAPDRLAGVDLGGVLRLTDASGAVLADRAEVVDLRREGDRATVTVYLDEAAAERVLGHVGALVVAPVR